MSYLRILEVSNVGYRNLRFKKLDLSKFDSGILRVLGEVGSGKSTLIEMLKLATENGQSIKSKNINKSIIFNIYNILLYKILLKFINNLNN